MTATPDDRQPEQPAQPWEKGVSSLRLCRTYSPGAGNSQCRRDRKPESGLRQLLVAVFPAWRMVRRVMSGLAPGSYLVISHLVSGDLELRQLTTSLEVSDSQGGFGRMRKNQEVRAFFDGLDLVEPGLVNITAWRPDGRDEDQSQHWGLFGDAGRKPA